MRRSSRQGKGSGGQNEARQKAFAIADSTTVRKRPNTVLDGLPENPAAPLQKRRRGNNQQSSSQVCSWSKTICIVLMG